MVDYKDRGKKIATMKGSFALAVKGDSVLVPRGGYHSNTYWKLDVKTGEREVENLKIERKSCRESYWKDREKWYNCS